MVSLRRLGKREPLWIIGALWPIALVAPLLPGLPKPFPSGLAWRQEVVVAFLLVVSLAALVRKPTRLSEFWQGVRRTRLFLLLPLSVFLVWGAASLFWAKSSISVLHYVATWGLYAGFFVLMSVVVQSPRVLRASLGLLAVIVSLISIICSLEFWNSTPELFQHSLILRRSIGLGEPLAVVIPLFASLAMSVRRWRLALICGVTSMLAWLATMQTLERAPTIGAGVGLLLLLLGISVKREWRPRTRSRALLLLAALVIVTGLQNMSAATNQPTSSSLTRLQTNLSADTNTQARLLVWAIAFEMLREHPVGGVGANNFEIAYAEARRQFSARYENSPLTGLQEELLAQRAHNEYLQIMAELGAVGFAIFLVFVLSLMVLAVGALRRARNPLALGAVCSLAAFAISSGVSSVSFRWLGSGLLFFFFAALTVRFAAASSRTPNLIVKLTPGMERAATMLGLSFAIVVLSGMSFLGVNTMLRGVAREYAASDARQSESTNKDLTERMFRSALRWNPYDGPTHFDFGNWLSGQGRGLEATSHLRFAIEHGLNSSPCFALLAAAQAHAGDTRAAEQTLAHAVEVYPRSVFLRVRHSIALAEIGETEKGRREYETALKYDAPAARGWRQLMCFGPNVAQAVARTNPKIAPPNALSPEVWANPAIAEHAARQPTAYPVDDTDRPEIVEAWVKLDKRR